MLMLLASWELDMVKRDDPGNLVPGSREVKIDLDF